MEEILDRVYYHNTVRDYLIVLGAIFIGIMLVKFFKRAILLRLIKWTKSTETRLDNYLIESFSRFGIPILYFLIIYISLNYLTLTDRANDILEIAVTVAVTIMVIRFLISSIVLIIRSYLHRRHPNRDTVNELGAISLIVNVVIWFIGLGFLLDNMGYDLTAVIAGLGVGGIAVALAAQNILGDLFNYFVIFLDKPFEVGDFLVIDDKTGTVEHIGVKTTRIKTLSGEQLVFANSDLTSSRIHNFKRMQRRRIVFTIGVTYQTSYENLERIPSVLKNIVESQIPVEFERAHFKTYGDSSLDFEVVYYVLDPTYVVYMDIQQAINLRIFREFESMGIEIAYPTRTLFVVNQQEEESREKQL
ncbi:mechanosensitive ion channel family protein [Pontibacter cellulosilyticus]|uniref:Mechanosensitive ion channel family protein n=1 Tax=Pontibacter cellulosilyticus TaxID=1720253 RepID=A0A923N7A2_9BACT|nr:mechanosensitive ion channel family protein [Pontibacter cellulosilyticus]MBC5993089.1 mechanosensitive ion channel family protein [Pontibacter cellulosilyticus]